MRKMKINAQKTMKQTVPGQRKPRQNCTPAEKAEGVRMARTRLKQTNRSTAPASTTENSKISYCKRCHTEMRALAERVSLVTSLPS